MSAEAIQAAVGHIGDEALSFRTDLAASAGYRAHLAAVLATRALDRAAARCR